MNNIAAVDLFCGIGGLTHGLEKSGINVVAGIDIDESCRYAYEKNNNSRFLQTDIDEVTGEYINGLFPKGSVRLLAGCAPCQPYSSIRTGKKSEPQEEKQIKSFMRLIREILPDLVTMENVANLRSRPIYKEFISTLDDLDYNVWENNVNSADYGVPQKRRRLVVLASKLGPISMLPKTTVPEDYRTVEQTIKGLPKLKAGQTSKSDPMHRARDLSDLNLKRIRASKQDGTWMDWDDELKLKCHLKESGKSFKAVYGRMSWKRPAPTITTNFSNLGSGRFGHPTQSRAITPREAALLQTFPLEYEFLPKGSHALLNQTGRWIGNAVPVKLAENIGLSIVKSIKRNGKDDF